MSGWPAKVMSSRKSKPRCSSPFFLQACHAGDVEHALVRAASELMPAPGPGMSRTTKSVRATVLRGTLDRTDEVLHLRSSDACWPAQSRRGVERRMHHRRELRDRLVPFATGRARAPAAGQLAGAVRHARLLARRTARG